MRALSLVASRRRRGAEVFATELAQRLDGDHGIETAVLAMSAAGELPIDAVGRGRLDPPAVARAVRRTRAHDVVIANGSTSLPVAALARTTGGPPMVARSIGDPDAWVTDRLRRARVRWALRRAERVVALWPDAATRLAELHGLDPDRVDVIPNAADSDHFRPPATTVRAARRDELGIGDERVVLAVGALSEEKRIDAAIDAVDGEADTTLVVVGDGPQRIALEARASEATAPVRFVGPLDDVRPWYEAADVLVLPSRTEGMPAVVIEAGLCGLPVVATDVGGVGEVVEHGMTGLLVEPTALRGLSEAIREAATRQHEWGTAATARCRERFSLSTVAAQWAATLRSAC
ncbi:MAG: glycosyltransferase family 4 protein [Actinomycetota bacterium]